MEELNIDDIEWIKEPISGFVLISAELDSYTNPINSSSLYKVGKHKPTGLLLIIPMISIFNEPICLN